MVLQLNRSDVYAFPTNFRLSNSSIDENKEVGTEIGTLLPEDQDSDDTHTFELATGDGTNDADNSKFEIAEDKLVTKEVFDFETRPTLNVLVKTVDKEGTSFEKPLKITINDLTETSTGELKINDVSFYPNPVNNKLHISFTEDVYQLSIFSIEGSLLYRESIQNGSEYNLNLPFEYKGVIIIRIESDRGSIQKRLIKE